MFCEYCGAPRIDVGTSCSHCNKKVEFPSPDTSPGNDSRPIHIWIGHGLILSIIALTFYAVYTKDIVDPLITAESAPVEEESTESEETILSELGYSLKPVGYFNDMSLFDSKTLNSDMWYTHVEYYETQKVTVPNTNESFKNRNAIFSSVVKIVCQNNEYFYFGSGLNVDPSGHILTNYHVIEDLPNDACAVGFPDPNTGLITEAYWATIIYDKDDVTGYDLAYLIITSPIFDVKGNVYGYREKINSQSFPSFTYTDECLKSKTLLGDKILILGYPPLSGEALTVTDGVLSSLYSQDGYLVTSAKIVRGNSGGLAIDDRGCYVGVPTATYSNDNGTDEVLGKIIDAQFVYEFNTAITDDFESYFEALQQ